MDIRTANDKTAMLETLLNEARIEANTLRLRVEHYRRVTASTRLVMGHELKRPTTALSGYLDLAREDAEKAGMNAVVELIDKARTEISLLVELNAFYLDLLSVDHGTGDARIAPVDVGRVISEAIEHLPASLQPDARVHVSADGIPPVMLNRNALKMIVVNLLENALAYSPAERPVRLEVETSPEQRGTAEGELLKIRVIDQGDGIEPNDVKRVFKPFVRLDDAMKGSGLGLTLVRSLVDMCGGDVSIRSEDGQGTTVHVTLPLSIKDRWVAVVSP
jgi:two-component system, OmpR family, phosphate regulon sensor histidine kinase PhoR